MKKMYLLMALCLMCATTMRAEAYSGVFEEMNSFWHLDEATGVLTIGVMDQDPEGDFGGFGGIPDFISTSDENPEEGLAPWYVLRDKIEQIVIEEGIVTIGDRAFAMCMYAESVELPINICGIGDYAFYMCATLEELTIPEINLRDDEGELRRMRLNDRAFTGCQSLKKINCYQSIPPRWYGDPFENLEVSEIELFVPAENLEDYLYDEKSSWDEFDIKALPSPADELCEVTSSGLEFEFVHSDLITAGVGDEAALMLLQLFDQPSWYYDEGEGLVSPTDGAFLQIAFIADSPEDLRGNFSSANERLFLEGTVMLTRVDGVMEQFDCDGGEIIISVNEDGTAYNLVYSLDIYLSEEIQSISGTVSGICADVIPAGEGIENVQSATGGQKMLRNGHLFIESNGKIYNAQGAEVK